MDEIIATVLSSITVALFAVLGALKTSKREKASHRLIRKTIWPVLVVSICLGWVFQFISLLHKNTYRSDLVLRFQDTFAEKLVRERAEAATAINEYLQKRNWNAVTNENNIDSLETVLSFFDELGFYWKHGEISATVLHEHFYSDMRTYCQEAIGYMNKERKKESVTDWEYVEPLFNELTRVEAKRVGKNVTNCVWKTETLQQYLKSEMRLNERLQNRSPVDQNQLVLKDHVKKFAKQLRAFASRSYKDPNAIMDLENLHEKAATWIDKLNSEGLDTLEVTDMYRSWGTRANPAGLLMAIADKMDVLSDQLPKTP